MLLTGFEPDDVARSNLLDRSAVALYTSDAKRDDQRLAERVCVPSRASAGLEGHDVSRGARRLVHAEERVDSNDAGEPVGWSLGRRLRSATRDFHPILLVTRHDCLRERRIPEQVWNRIAQAADQFVLANSAIHLHHWRGNPFSTR